jgi:hypothetical protein
VGECLYNPQDEGCLFQDNPDEDPFNDGVECLDLDDADRMAMLLKRREATLRGVEQNELDVEYVTKKACSKQMKKSKILDEDLFEGASAFM